MAKHKLISAIDIGSSKVTVLVSQVREDDPDRLHIVGAASAPSRGVKKGQIVNIEEAVSSIVESVEAAERMAGFNIGKCYISVGGGHIGSQNSHGVVAVSEPQGEISPTDVQRVLEAARAVTLPTATEIIHVLPREFTVDSQKGVKDPVGMTGVRLEVDTHIVTGSSPVMRNLSKSVGEVGCDIVGMVFTGLASAYAVLSETEKELGVILVDIGGGTLSLAIFVEGALSYSSVIPVGAINVTKDLAAGLRVSLESAEKIKLFVSDHKAKDKEDDIDISSLKLPEELKTISHKTLVEGIIKPRLNEIFQVIGTEIKKSGFAGLTPSGIVLCGGGSLTVNIVESAKRMMAMPVRIGQPTGISGLIDEISSPNFATGVGLLKYGKSEGISEGSGFSIPKLPVGGIVGKVTEFIKSLLP